MLTTSLMVRRTPRHAAPTLADAESPADVLAWVGADPGRAEQALDAEQTRETPRQDVLIALTDVLLGI